MTHHEPTPRDTSDDENLPPELRYADSGGAGRPAPGPPVWVRATAVVLVVSVVAFYALSYFL